MEENKERWGGNIKDGRRKRGSRRERGRNKDRE